MDLRDQLQSSLGAAYSLDRELGRGGAALVYLARDRQGREVAIKVLRAELALAIGPARFLREIRVTSALRHAHIIPVLDVGEAEGQPYVVLPYMKGGTLRSRLERDKQFPVDDAVAIVSKLAGALEYAHNQGVIHRDVKPENILFDGDEPVLADFGIARALEHSADGGMTSSTGVVRGTPAYMSPEQASGERELDGRSDLYSLACVAYEMIAGIPAFVGPTEQSIIAQRLLSSPRPLSVYRPSVPQSIERVLERAFARLPADRWPTADAFARALEASARAPVAGAGRRSRRPVVAVAALVLVGGVLAYELAARAFSAAGSPLELNRLAVAPFTNHGAASVWDEGLVDVLSKRLDDAGPVRTVPTSVSLRAWKSAGSPVADRISAAELGRRTRATLVVFGMLERAGADSTHVSASLMDIASGRTFDIDVADSTSRMERIADSLTVRVLRLLERTRAIAAVPNASLKSRSLPALKAFLQGEQLYRANSLTAAKTSYEEAIALDSSFCLAYRRMRSMLRAISGDEDNPEGYRYALLAGARNRGLGARDSLLVLADSLAAAGQPVAPGFPEEALIATMRRRGSVIEEAVRQFPDDAEVQYELGEYFFHVGFRFGAQPRRTQDAFLAAIRLDSAFKPAYFHALELALPLDGRSAALRLAREYDKQDSIKPRYALFERLAAATPDQLPEAVAATDSLPVDTLLEPIVLFTRRSPDSAAMAVLVLERALQRKQLSRSDSVRVRSWLFRTLAFRGRLREAHGALTSSLVKSMPIGIMQLAQARVVSADTATRVLAATFTGADVRGSYFAIPIWAAARDTVSLSRAAAAFPAGRVGRGGSAAPNGAEIVAASARARLALIRGDTVRALAELRSIRGELCSWWCADDRLLEASLLLALGRPGEASASLDRFPPMGGPTALAEPMWMCERGRAAVEEGKSKEARPYLDFVAHVWNRADPPFQPAVAYARVHLDPGVSRGDRPAPPLRPAPDPCMISH